MPLAVERAVEDLEAFRKKTGLGRIHLFGPSCGGMYVELETDNTTQECSKCGGMHSPPLKLKDRIYRCPRGHTKEGYVNASGSILGRALEAVQTGTPELPRADRAAYTSRKGMRGVSGSANRLLCQWGWSHAYLRYLKATV